MLPSRSLALAAVAVAASSLVATVSAAPAPAPLAVSLDIGGDSDGSRKAFPDADYIDQPGGNGINLAVNIGVDVDVLVNSAASRKACRSITCGVNIGFDIVKTAQQAARVSTHSWEVGATTQALLEVYNSSLSVFGTGWYTNGIITAAPVSKVPALVFAKPFITTDNVTLVNGDGALGDPASLVMPAILIGRTNATYTKAAARQVQHVLSGPRWGNGAISHREDVAELWADSEFMVPPAVAFQAVRSQSPEMMNEAIQQLFRYRQVLQLVSTANGPYNGPGRNLWQHIVGPQSQTLGLWSTGQAWVVLGAMRVLATMKQWPASSGWTQQQNQIKELVFEILVALQNPGISKDRGLYRNYIYGGAAGYNDTSNPNWFGEVSGTAGLTAAAYRLMTIDPSYKSRLISATTAARRAVTACIDPNTGIAAPVVNPLDWFAKVPLAQGASPEGQAFVSMMGAAYRDCVVAGVCQQV